MERAREERETGSFESSAAKSMVTVADGQIALYVRLIIDSRWIFIVV